MLFPLWLLLSSSSSSTLSVVTGIKLTLSCDIKQYADTNSSAENIESDPFSF